MSILPTASCMHEAAYIYILVDCNRPGPRILCFLYMIYLWYYSYHKQWQTYYDYQLQYQLSYKSFSSVQDIGFFSFSLTIPNQTM